MASDEKPAAKLGDEVVDDGGFVGILKEELSPTVLIHDVPAALLDSIAQGTSNSQDSDTGRVITASGAVFMNDRPVARLDDKVEGIDDSGEHGKIVAKSTVVVGR